jgi:ribosomal protein S18 acetylase RimI-like enzyme
LEKPKRSDFGNIETLLSQSFPHMKSVIPQWMFHVKKEDSFILKNKGEIIGLVDIAKHSDDNQFWINLIATHPDYRNQKIGSKMLEFAENRVKAKYKSDTLNLHAEGNKIENLIFYTNNGWKINKLDPYGYFHTASVHFKKNIL